MCYIVLCSQDPHDLLPAGPGHGAALLRQEGRGQLQLGQEGEGRQVAQQEEGARRVVERGEPPGQSQPADQLLGRQTSQRIPTGLCFYEEK